KYGQLVQVVEEVPAQLDPGILIRADVLGYIFPELRRTEEPAPCGFARTLSVVADDQALLVEVSRFQGAFYRPDQPFLKMVQEQVGFVQRHIGSELCNMVRPVPWRQGPEVLRNGVVPFYGFGLDQDLQLGRGDIDAGFGKFYQKGV